MTVKLSELLKIIAVMLILGGCWFVYQEYLLVRNPDGTIDFMGDGTDVNLIIGLSVVAVATLLCFIYIVINYFRQWLGKRISSKVISGLANDLSRCYYDDNFISYVSKFGIALTPDTIKIKSDVMTKCSLNELAKLIVMSFYKHFSPDSEIGKVIYSLADLILEAWPDEVISEFVFYFDDESSVLGAKLKYAIDHQRIKKDINEFNMGIKSRLDAIEKQYEDINLATVQSIDSQFGYSNYLIDGGSIVKRWLIEKFWINGFGKSAVVE